jgi:HAT1-interacting factor 1
VGKSRKPRRVVESESAKVLGSKRLHMRSTFHLPKLFPTHSLLHQTTKPTLPQTHPPSLTMATPTDPSTGPTSLQKKLDHLKASATQQYSLKNYSAAAEFYSEAAEVQDEINGEMSPENADLLYQYGRCLYHVGVSKSDVLGGKVASNEEPKRKKRKTAPVAESSAAGAAKGEGVVANALKSGEEKVAVEDEDQQDAKPSSDKPFFQITGDENWTDSEDEDEDEGAEEGNGDEEEEEDDDFAIAYEILDVARVLLGRKLESLQSEQGEQIKGEGENKTTPSPEARQLRERLADTHDLQAEIKLENEQFADAVTDAKAALGFKLQLYPQESGMVAEAHYKLAIALDFAALPAPPTEEEESAAAAEGESKKPKEGPQVNEEMRAEAATEMEKAIASCQLRIQKDTEAGKTANISDIKSMVSEMKNRLAELRKPAEELTTTTTGFGDAPDGADPLRGVLGAMLGASKAEQAKVLQQATSQANDLSGLVKKRKAKAVEGESVVEGKGKKAKVEE